MAEKKVKASVVDIVLERILKQIEEENRLPWERPYVLDTLNWYTGNPYKGINRFLLGGGEWCTFKQMQEYNEKHKTNFVLDTGSHARIVVFYSPKEKEISEDEMQSKPWDFGKYVRKQGKCYFVTFVLRYYNVFNILWFHDAEGNTPVPKLKTGECTQFFYEPEKLISGYSNATGVQIIEDSANGQVYYTELDDNVHTVAKITYKSLEAYYRTLFHELVHSTGVPGRLNRASLKQYGKKKEERSKEELVAEMGAMLIASDCGFTEDRWEQNSVNYVSSWVQWIKDNKKEVLNGMFAAQRAVEYIFNAGVDTDAEETAAIITG